MNFEIPTAFNEINSIFTEFLLFDYLIHGNITSYEGPDTVYTIYLSEHEGEFDLIILDMPILKRSRLSSREKP